MSVTIKLRRSTSNEWSNINPVLANGEPGYETDTKKLKIGDGTTLWNSLAYILNSTGGDVTLDAETIDDRISSLLVAGEGITINYNDNANILTINASNSVLPTGSIYLHNGNTQTAQVLQFNNSNYQSVITGPTPSENTNAQRLILQGQKGSGTGEGGDVYIWGGDSDINGGDIKIYAGDADNSPPIGYGSYGGYVNIDGGKGVTAGGNVEITAGYSEGGQAGHVNIVGGPTSTGVHGNVVIQTNNSTKNWTFNNYGDLSIPGNILLNNGTSVASGTYDNGTYGQGGISLNCAVGYELNWQGGHLRSSQIGNPSGVHTLFIDSPIQIPGTGVSNMTVSVSGLTFPNGTSQTSAGVTSDITGITGASGISNMISISQANYDNIVTKNPNTIYFIV